MGKPIIEVHNISKKYHIGAKQRYYSLRDTITSLIKKPLIWKTRNTRPSNNEIWALKDVSFQVMPGEVLGIIGRNGAGKTTLLKILSQITPPTQGKIILRGRVASLLEVGTGFHPELTGRENIFLNGAILGMTRKEVKNKFDEIVDFAEIEKFLDTPVKHYSSGMYMRLAFAVAAHLEPEILLVDEVLAVGDSAFQKKCLEKMKDVSKHGRTVLFVSHNMTAIKALSNKGLVLKNGTTIGRQNIEKAVDDYLKQELHTQHVHFPFSKDEVIIHSFDIMQKNKYPSEYDGGLPIEIEIKFELKKDLKLFRIGIFLKSSIGELITRSLLADWNEKYENMKRGIYVMEGKIPANFLTHDNYIIQIHSSRYGIKDYGFDEIIGHNITLIGSTRFNRAHIGEKTFGTVLLNAAWKIAKV